jgi:hypothetical protein
MPDGTKSVTQDPFCSAGHSSSVTMVTLATLNSNVTQM